MSAATVIIVRTSVANTASVLAAFRRAGAAASLEDDPDAVRSAECVVLPGVGAFGAAMAALRTRCLDQAIRDRIQADRPTLAICLGLQLLAESSEESPDETGFGVVPDRATRFPSSLRVPQLGWNRVQPDAGARLLRAGDAYFANSYCLRECPAGWHASWADYGHRFIAAIERGAVLACQFHPELSGLWGIELLQRWMAGPVVKERRC